MPAIRRANIGRRSRNSERTSTHRQQQTRNSAQEDPGTSTIEEQQRTGRRNPREANVQLERAAFLYNNTINYSELPCVSIGPMDVICQFCNALKFRAETPGLCCAGGKVKLIPLTQPPEPLRSLLYGDSHESKHFLTNVQKYNVCFQMTSFGANIIEEQGFNPTFKIQGQIHHRTGSLLPPANEEHKFLQIYFIGNTDTEIDQRCEINRAMKRRIISEMRELLHEHNALVRIFKTALEDMPSDDYKIVIRADKRPVGSHERQYNAPTVEEIAVVMVGENFESRDIVLKRRNDGELQRVHETHRSYDALQYPLMFPRGEDGYHLQIKMINPTTGEETNKKVSSMNYYAYRLMIRQDIDNHLLRYRRLFQQYAVDVYVKVETERLNFIRFNQAKLRSEEYIHLRDAVISERNVNDIGRLTILPSTYVGSPRHMHEYAQDAMTYVRNYGRPDLFITFTCNPKWDEITKLLEPGQTSSDRHDITARVFRQKQKSLIDFIVKHNVFGKVRCWMYSIEWQKRGLPHSHALIWLLDKIRPDQIDDIISAEIPDIENDIELYEIIKTHMIHGPCGQHNLESPCMVGNKCSKRYPRPLLAETITGNDGYPLYRRRSLEHNGKTITIKVKGNDVVVDNSWVVPYSPLLSKTFKTHCNVEFCNSIKSIKYVCKYVNKGSDMAVFGIAAPEANDEVMQYQLGRYVSCNEAIWRIYSFPIHERHPTVVHLAVHLENGQRVYFTENNAAQRAERPPATTLTSFFNICQNDEFAKTLLYSEIPRYYTWNATSKMFQRRKKGQAVSGVRGVFSTDALGRIYTVNPKNDECFYLRLLLVNVRGPTSFDSIKTVDGVMCATYREACQRMQLVENDNHWDTTLAEAIITAPAHQIRTLFAIIISTCFPSNATELWNKYKDFMADDILHRVRSTTLNYDTELNDEMYNEVLINIEDMCLLMCGSLLSNLGIPAPNREMHNAFNREMQREREYDLDTLNQIIRTNTPLLTPEQKNVYEKMMEATESQNGGIFFVDAPGGTGKTFLLSLLLATVRARSEIALAVASSGIAATLLDGGRTAHSAFKLPLNLQINDEPTCNISKNSTMAKVLKSSKIIIWDECTMANKRALEALDRTMKDLRNNRKHFGGATILLAGDFRQTLPVIPRSTPADEINACLKQSYLWRHVTKLKLTKNMRVEMQNDHSAEIFSKQLLAIGNGDVPIDINNGLITFPQNFCNFATTKEELIEQVFPNIEINRVNHDWLGARAILAAKNKDVDELNQTIQNSIEGQLYTFRSIDCMLNPEDAINYPTEFLNSLDLPGLPPHELKLKRGTVIIMLRNLNQPKLCNGTRLVVTQLNNNLIQASILKGKFKGEEVLIPRIPLIANDLSFEFKRIQFPVRIAFAITINKSQGQSLDVCGINLENPCFSHGQLYVACSRVGKPSSLFIYSPNQQTKNVVYRAALN